MRQAPSTHHFHVVPRLCLSLTLLLLLVVVLIELGHASVVSDGGLILVPAPASASAPSSTAPQQVLVLLEELGHLLAHSVGRYSHLGTVPPNML